VRYGAKGTWTQARVFTGGVACSNEVFGDPLVGAVKRCETRAASSVQPPLGDTSPPTQPTDLAVESASSTAVSLSWSESTDDKGVAGYGVSRNGVSAMSVSQPSAEISGLRCGVAYQFGVDAHDAAGNRSDEASVIGSTAACGDTQAPTAPANVVATTRNATSISLLWSASTDNVGVTGYTLYRGGTQVGSTTGTAGIFSNLTCNTNYTLAVEARDAAGNRSRATTVMVATTACSDTTPPSAPGALAASDVTQTGLKLSWTSSSDNVAVTGYDVYRNDTKVDTVAGMTSSQTGLSCGTPYTFAVVARDAAGNSSTKAQLAKSTTACVVAPPPSSAWTTVAVENATFTLTENKEVRYGKDPNWSQARILGPGTHRCDNLTFGDPYVGIVKQCDVRATTQAPVTPLALPAASGLKWPRPTLINPITVQASNSNRVLNFNDGQDYIVRLPSTPLTARGGLVLDGGRNVVVVGGEIRQDTLHSSGEGVDLQYGIYAMGQTGTLHIEGVWVHGQGIGQALVLGEGSGATVQVQNSRLESLHPVGDIHTDAIQSWAGPSVFRVYNVSLRSAGLSLQMQPREFGFTGALNWHYERIDMAQLTPAAPALNKSWGGTAGNYPWWSEYHQDLWLSPHPQNSYPVHCNWSPNTACWNPGGGTNVSGGNLTIGTPPGGDFVPASRVGLSYTG
jgi:chitodextrinase